MDEEHHAESGGDSGSMSASSLNTTVHSSEDEPIYTVERIVSHCKKKGKYMYRIRWQNYDSDGDTWEPEANLFGGECKILLQEYKKRNNIVTTPEKGKFRGYVEVSNSDAEVEAGKTDWFVDKDDKEREIRGLYVQDRKLTESEKVLNDLQIKALSTGAASRLTRSSLRSIMSPVKKTARGNRKKEKSKYKDPSSDTSSDSTVPQKKKRREKKVSPSPKKATPTPIRRRVLSSSSSSPEKKAARQRIEAARAALSSSDEDEPIATSSKSYPEGQRFSEVHAPPVVWQKTPAAASNISPQMSLVSKPKKKSNSEQQQKKSGSTVSRSGFKIPKKGSEVSLKPEIPRRPEKPTFNRMPGPSKVNPDMRETKKENPREQYGQRPPAEQPASGYQNFSHKNHQVSAYVSTLMQSQLSRMVEPAAQTRTINASGQDLMTAVRAGNIDTVRAALAKPAAVNLNARDEKGRTILHWIAENTCDPSHIMDDMIDCLVEAGANMRITDMNGRIPLHSAIYYRRICHARKLLHIGSPLDVPDKKGETPLVTALRLNFTDLGRTLLMYGASIHSLTERDVAKTHHKAVNNYINRVRRFLMEAAKKVLPSSNDHQTVTPVFQSPIFESSRVERKFLVERALSKDTVYLILFAIMQGSEKQTSIVCWGDSPLQEVTLNDTRLELLTENNKFIYVAVSLKPGNNVLKYDFDPDRTKFCHQILVAQGIAIPVPGAK